MNFKWFYQISSFILNIIEFLFFANNVDPVDIVTPLQTCLLYTIRIEPVHLRYLLV